VFECVIVVIDLLDEVVAEVMMGLIVVLWEVFLAFEVEIVDVASGTQSGRTVDVPL
jgi:hypothetical protein